METYGRPLVFWLVTSFILCGLGLAGCGGVNPNRSSINPQPTPTPTPPNFGTPTPIPTPVPFFPTPTPIPTPSPTPFPTPMISPTITPTPSPTPVTASSIAGRVLDSQTGLPISGFVLVSLEKPAGDFIILSQTLADASGNFRFDNVPVNVPGDSTGNGFAIMITAQGADGSLFAPALLTSGGGDLGSGDAIVPGTNVGTIPLQRSAAAPLTGSVSSTNASNTPISVRVHLAAPVVLFTGHHFPVPFAQQPADLITDAANVACSGGSGACALFSLTLPASTLQVATFNRSGFVLIPSAQPVSHQFVFQAFSVITSQPDCTPNTVQGPGFLLAPGQTLPLANQPFLGCQ
ncbi:MAG TPA: carboxypeptidase-like regulatory domain-containing protein [Terriglobales bacterium]|nr:carboxypeptidase-like regulatory domain-containing protein [Terriglobales bacterium]